MVMQDLAGNVHSLQLHHVMELVTAQHVSHAALANLSIQQPPISVGVYILRPASEASGRSAAPASKRNGGKLTQPIYFNTADMLLLLQDLHYQS